MTYRLYFNRCEDWPQIWSIDTGPNTLESNVCDWRTEGAVTMRAGRVEDANAIDRRREPVCWCEIECASVRLEGGAAVFVGPDPYVEPTSVSRTFGAGDQLVEAGTRWVPSGSQAFVIRGETVGDA